MDAVIRNAVCVFSGAAVPGLWLQRAPHWSIAFAALAFAVWSSGRGRFWIGFSVFALYVGVWFVSPTDTHRSFQLAVLHAPGMDCADYDFCADGAVEWSERVYGEDVNG